MRRRDREGKSENEMCIINQLLFWGQCFAPIGPLWETVQNTLLRVNPSHV